MAMSMPEYQPNLRLGMQVEIVDTDVLGSEFGEWRSKSGEIVALHHGKTNGIAGLKPYTLVTVFHRGVSVEVRASHIRPLIGAGDLLISASAKAGAKASA